MQNDSNLLGISRRNFVTGAALGAMSVATIGMLNGCSDKTDDTSSTEETIAISQTIDCDLVVVGGGASGCATAVRAAENGLNVVLLEKTETIGGASLNSWAAATYGSSFAEAANEVLDVNPVISTWVADSHWRVDAAAIRQLLVQSGPAFDWMAGHGWEFLYLGMGAGMLQLPDYTLRNGLWTDMLDSTVVSGGGQVLTTTTAKSLITDDNGAVIGVIAQDGDDAGIQINAKAVNVATGGYAGNYDMVLENSGFGGVCGGLPQNIGEGLEMAWDAGAKVPDNFGGQMLHQTLAQATSSLVNEFDALPAKYPMIVTYLPMMLNVGATGVRFRDETLTLDSVPAANSSAFQGPFHYVVLSKKIIDTLVSGGLAAINMATMPGMPPEFVPEYDLNTPWEGAYDVFDAMVEGGYGYKGDTIEELAENAGMDLDTFNETFNNYEQFCADGVDTQFNKSADYLLSYGEDGPYYIVIAEENNLCSWGGLLTNTKYQVLNDDRLPVSGLYATGVEAGSVLYNDTYTGFGIGMCNTVTSGYLCGQSIADELSA